MTWLLTSISDQLAFSLRPLTTMVASVRRKVLLPAFAFLIVSCVSLIAVTVPATTSFGAGRCFVVGLAALVADGVAAMAPVASTPARIPAIAIPANTLPNIGERPPVFSTFPTRLMVAPAAEATGREVLDLAEKTRRGRARLGPPHRRLTERTGAWPRRSPPARAHSVPRRPRWFAAGCNAL